MATQTIYRYGIIENVTVKIQIPTAKQYRVLGGPAAGESVVIPRAEASQLSVLITDPVGEGDGLEAGIGVADDVSELVVIDALGDEAGG